MSPDLESLRIERAPEEPRRTGVSALWKYLCLLLFLVLVGAGLLVWSVLPRGVSHGGPWSQAKTGTTPEREEPRAPSLAPPAVRGSGFTASGWVKLPLDFPVRATPLIEGRVESIAVVEGDRVEAGQELARLYDVDLRAELAAAEARVAEAKATQEKLSNGARPQEVNGARAEVERVAAELAAANEVLAHSRELQPKGAIPLEELQRDEAAARALAA